MDIFIIVRDENGKGLIVEEIWVEVDIFLFEGCCLILILLKKNKNYFMIKYYYINNNVIIFLLYKSKYFNSLNFFNYC